MPPDVAPAAPATTPNQPAQQQAKLDPQNTQNSGAGRAAAKSSPDLTPIDGGEQAKPKADPKAAWKEFGKSFGKTLKFKGEERSLADLDPESAYDLMLKGHGATKLVEESKAKSAEAEKVLAAKKAIESGNDEEALEAILAIGGKRGVALLQKLQAQQAERAELEANISPEVKALLEENERLSAEQKKWQAEQTKLKQAEQAKVEEQVMHETRTKVVEMAGGLLKALNLPAGKAEVMAPHVGRAMQEAMDVGVDPFDPQYTDRVIARANELAQESVFGVFDGLSPDETYDALGPERVAKLARVHLTRRNLKAAAPLGTPRQTPKAAPKDAPKLGDPKYLRL